MDRDIVKANTLIEACYHPASLYQMRLLMAVLCQIKSADPLSHKQEFTVTARGLAELIGNTLRTSYRILVRAAVTEKPREPTRPSRAAKQCRPEGKHRRSQLKDPRQHLFTTPKHDSEVGQ